HRATVVQSSATRGPASPRTHPGCRPTFPGEGPDAIASPLRSPGAGGTGQSRAPEARRRSGAKWTARLLSWRISVEVVPQHLGTAGVAQLGHGLGLDLPDPLPRDAVDLSGLVEGL